MKYWDNITKIYEKQRAKGLSEYGQTLEENTSLTFNERIDYIEEELVDALVYLEHLRAKNTQTTKEGNRMVNKSYLTTVKFFDELIVRAKKRGKDFKHLEKLKEKAGRMYSDFVKEQENDNT